MFFGTDFFSGIYAMQAPAIDMGAETDISLHEGSYDHLFLSTDTTKNESNIYDSWEYSTKINATFEKNLDGGNSGFSLKNTDTIIIKCREKTYNNSLEWITLYIIPVNKIADFDFTKDYYYAKSGVDYEFMCISSLAGNINSYETTEVSSQFEGICIADKTTFISTKINIEYPQIVRNLNSNVLLGYDNYPTVVSNSVNNYDSGTVSGAFLKIDNCNVAVNGQMAYRKSIIDWLSNRKAKILKLDNGRRWLVRITGSPTEQEDGHPDLWKISFDFVEIGNADSEKALYINNLSDVQAGVW